MKTKLLPALMFVLLGGCASTYDQHHPYAHDWHIGIVEEIGNAATLFPITAFDCRSQAGTSESENTRYAYVRYVFTGGTTFLNSIPKQRYVIVAVPDDLGIREGEQVYVNIHDCSQRLAHPASQTG